MTQILKRGDRRRVQFCCEGETMTKQSMQAECDINGIMKKFERTGVITHAREQQGEYGNYIAAPEFHEAINKVMEAEAMFMSLPAKVRKKFDNDAGSFLEFAQNPDNLSEMRDLGLAAPLPSKKDPDKSGSPDPDKSGSSAPPQMDIEDV